MNVTNSKLFLKSMLSNLDLIKAGPEIDLFLAKYMSKFTLMNVSGDLIIHSHLPPLNSKAFRRFVSNHIVKQIDGPTHAQVGITNLCNQDCTYCYSKKRTGKLMNKEEIIQTVMDLKELGVCWLGITGGEPLLNKDLAQIISLVGDDITLKLFTNGTNMSYEKAKELKAAGLTYVSISLDHWEESIHNTVRRSDIAFKCALLAIENCKKAGLHVSVSSVLSKEMIKNNETEKLISFLIAQGVHEAWLSEAKPTSEYAWNEESVINEAERQKLCKLQDEYNAKGKITINYLGHFEGKESFGCFAGNKMVYIDSFGEVSPCVFIPLSFGNVHEKSLINIFSDMKLRFPTENKCFINYNYPLLKPHAKESLPLNPRISDEIMTHVEFGDLSTFNVMLQKRKGKKDDKKH